MAHLNSWPPLKCPSQVMATSIGGMGAFSLSSQQQLLHRRGPFRKLPPCEHLGVSYQLLAERET